MPKNIKDVVFLENEQAQKAQYVDEIFGKEHPSRIAKVLQTAALISLECFPPEWLRDDVSYLERLQSEADRLRIWRYDYLCDDRLFDSFLHQRTPSLMESLITTFCSLLDAIARAYHVLDDTSILLTILSRYPETPPTTQSGEQDPSFLHLPPSHVRYADEAVVQPQEIMSYVCYVMQFCFTNFVHTQDVILGSAAKSTKNPIRTWLEQITQHEGSTSASDLVDDIEETVHGLFELSCSFFWVPSRSFEKAVEQKPGSSASKALAHLAESSSSKGPNKLYDIARNSIIHEAALSNPPEARSVENGDALDVLLWHILVLEPKLDISDGLSNLQSGAFALNNYSIALDNTVRLVPYEDLCPSMVLWGLITPIIDTFWKQADCDEFRSTISAALALMCQVTTAVNWRLRTYHENVSCRHFLSKSLSSSFCFWCDSWQLAQVASRGWSAQGKLNNLLSDLVPRPELCIDDFRKLDNLNQDVRGISLRALRMSLSVFEQDMKDLVCWLFDNYDARQFLNKQQGQPDPLPSISLSSPRTTLDPRLQAQLSTVTASLGRQHFHGTLRWLRSESEISRWLQSPAHNRLCVQAPAQSGKSIFAWYVAQRLVSERFWVGLGGPATWFDCSIAKLKRHHAATAVESIVAQIVAKYCQESSGEFLGSLEHGVSSLVQQMSTSHYRNLRNAETILYFKALLQAVPRKPVHIIIDNIHEYPDNQACFLLDFLDTFTTGPPLLKVLVTGQQVGHLAERCESGAWANSNCLKYTIPLHRLQTDITNYIKTIAALRKDKLQMTGMQTTVLGNIQELVALVNEPGSTASVFTWAGLMQQQLLSCSSPQELEEMMFPGSHYSKTVQSLYIRFLVQLESALVSRNSDLLSSIPTLIMWITCSHRPLTEAQAFEVFRLCYPHKDPSNNDDSIELHFKFRSALARLRPLLRAQRTHVGRNTASSHKTKDAPQENDETPVLQWVDPSFGIFLMSQDKGDFTVIGKAFLTQHHSDTGLVPTGRLLFTSDDAHARLFQTCLSFLEQNTPSENKGPVGVRGSSATPAQFRAQNPFLEDAACLWHYHVGKISDRDQAFKCMTRLDAFLRSPASRRWMEVAITLQDSVEWLFTVKFMLSRWAKEVEHPDFMGELHWVKDISGDGFREYELILQNNPNEIRYADASFLLPRTARNGNRRDVVVPAKWTADIPGEPIAGHFDFRDSSCRSHWKLVGGTALPNQLVSGENAENSCGFLSFDMNQGDGERGLFLIDRLCNHPRLVWECFGPTRKRLGKSLPSTEMKEDHHSLWETLSASLSPDGTSVVAVFRENIPKHQNRRVKVIVWEFHASDENRLISWKAQYAQAVESEKATGTTGEPYQGDRDNDIWQQLLDSRPVAPSTEPLEAGTDQDWSDVLDVYEDSDTLPKEWPPESTRHLAAFKEGNFLVTFRGLFSLDTQEYEQRYKLPLDTIGAAVVPNGMHILRISRGRRDVLEVWDTNTFSITKRVSSGQLDSSLLFSEIIDCSTSGKFVALTLEDQGHRSCLLAVLSLETLALSTVYRYSREEKSEVSITQAYFCRQDNHVVFLLKQDSGLGRQYSVWGGTLAGVCGEAMDVSVSVARLESMESEPVGVLFPGHDRCHNCTDETGHGAKVAIFDHDRSMLVRCIPNSILRDSVVLVATLASPESPRSRYLSQRSVCSTAIIGGQATVTSVFLSIKCLVDTESLPTEDNLRTFTLSATIRWGTWNMRLTTPATVYDEPDRARCGSLSRELSIQSGHRQSHGVALSPNLQILAWWLGSRVHFVRVRRGHYGAVQEVKAVAGEAKEIVEGVQDCLCQSVTFSPSEQFGLSFWISAPRQESAEPRVIWALIHQFHQLDLDGMQVRAYGPLRISSGSVPSHVDFHPSRNLAALTLSDGGMLALGFDYSAEPDHMFKKQITTLQIATWLTIREETNSQPSPRSTGKEGGAGRLQLRFSTCGAYLYSQGWHVFALVRDLFQGTAVPAGTAVLRSCFAEWGKQVVWKRPADSHPIVLEEDVMYAGEQHRYKVFRVRDYLVLGWSADAMSFFKSKKQLVEPTWYRRVICAIPQSIASQKAVILWPSDPQLHMAAVFSSDTGIGKAILPTVLISALKGNDMSVSAEVDEGGNFVDGWIRGHAFGCPYHLKS